MLSDQDIGKKEAESVQLDPFLDAYRLATGIELVRMIPSSENPDFIVVSDDNRVIGAELTKLMRPPEEQLIGEPEPYDQLEHIHYLIEKKEDARSKRYVKKVADNILVIELVDGSLSNLLPLLDGLQGEFTNHGFEDVWLADYSEVEAYGTIELFALFPGGAWGLCERPNAESKPYG